MSAQGKIFAWGLVACIAFLSGPPVRALDPTEKPANYIVTRWDTEDGLPHNSIRHLYQSRDGFLWIGTTQGLARFDGLKFTSFTHGNTPGLPHTQITSITETPDGILWIATAGGLAQYRDGVFTAFGRAEGLKADVVNALRVAPDGSLWIATGGGITRWVDGKFVNDIDTSAFDLVGMRHIALDRRKQLWLSVGSEALRYADGKFTRFGRAEGLPAQPLQMIREDAAGRLLAVTQAGVYWLDGDRFVPVEQNASLSNPRAITALVDRNGNLWLGSMGGLDRVSGGTVTRFVDANGVPLAGVDALIEDREGCLWVGGSTGLARITDRRGYTMGKNEGVLGSLGMAVRQTRDGSIWMSSWGGGVARFQNGTVRQYAMGAPLSHDSITVIYEAADGTMWLGNRGSSIDRLDGDKVTTFVYPSGVATSRPVTAIDIGPDGEFLLGIGQRGLLQLRDGKIQPVPEAASLAAETVRAIHRTRDGRLLIGTSKGLFQRAANRTWERVTPPGLRDSPREIRAFLEEDNGVIWLATGGLGLIRWAPGDARAYGTRVGMVDDTLFSVVDDGTGSLWVSSARGSARVRKAELADLDRGAIATLNVLTLGRADGLLSGATPGGSAPSAVLLADGRLMTGTDTGIAVVDPRRLPLNTQPPTVIIESVIADDKPLALVSGRAISIPRGTNRLEIRYTALSLIAPHRLRFRYQLEGSDPTWIEAGRARTASYTHLAPGSYNFRVLACNNDGVWNQTGATCTVMLQPLFYQTRWFQVLGTVVALTALAGIYWSRVRLLQRKQQTLQRARDELELQVARRTSDLAHANSSLHSEIAARKQTEAQLLLKKHSLEKEIGEGKRLQSEVEATQLKLRAASRQAGMAEVATGVLHNVGNVLNSVNVSATLVSDHVRHSKSGSVAKLAALLDEHRADLPAFLTQDPRGRMIPGYLATLTEALAQEQATLLGELDHLRKNVDHIKEVVAMQQDYANTSGFIETVQLNDLVDEALRMNTASLAGHEVALVRDFRFGSTITTDRHKVAQILINLVRNAKQACDESGRADRQIVVRTRAGERGVEIAIADNGAGIPAENITRIFNHGFTTKPDGHGFGLHHSALAARELGGSLRVQSDGPGTGATFTLELPAELQREAQPAPGSNQAPIYP
jgi:ligand-binding sensor domain-containing protein/signal transduction histidine kinase